MAVSSVLARPWFILAGLSWVYLMRSGVRPQAPPPPFILMSAIDPKAPGIHTLLSKPFTEDELLGALRGGIALPPRE